MREDRLVDNQLQMKNPKLKLKPLDRAVRETYLKNKSHTLQIMIGP